jgi:transcriptional regulator with XRE-family HTH domain
MPRTFAMNLKTLRIARGLTQTQLAAKLKLKQAYIAHLETDAAANPTLNTLRRLAKALKCKVSELVE